MKMVFLIIGIAAFSGVSAQATDTFSIYKNPNLKDNKGLFKQLHKQTSKVEINKLVHSYTLPNSDKVLITPNYRMPIIVPGNGFVYNMPALYIPSFRDSLLNLPGSIPNASVEYKLSITR
jgi:hypothetical protein